MNVKLNLCALLLACLAPISYANMSVYPMSVDMNNQGEGNVRVISRTNDVQFIKTTIVKISDAGTAKEKENEIKTGDPNAIVVMPPKFALPAGASKMVRLVSMEPPSKRPLIALNLKPFRNLMTLWKERKAPKRSSTLISSGGFW
ncbi:hypothetical protein QTP25_12035 [Klebsiella oxytoca]|uniref:hypothetical protein n=1 Tax=Klebsiella oxytoca TaxID=571 RepID=UPI002591C8E3|nr:hypothetical protein [Klebsiella oxytoca]MDM4195983.1 hypothetical protein [Klebsiella oxytoca]